MFLILRVGKYGMLRLFELHAGARSGHVLLSEPMSRASFPMVSNRFCGVDEVARFRRTFEFLILCLESHAPIVTWRPKLTYLAYNVSCPMILRLPQLLVEFDSLEESSLFFHELIQGSKRGLSECGAQHHLKITHV